MYSSNQFTACCTITSSRGSYVLYKNQFTACCTITSNRGSYVLDINQFTDCLTTTFNTRSYSFKQSAACCNLHRKKCMHAHAKLTDQITAQNWK